MRRYWTWKACQKEAHEEIWTDPCGYYFCNIVAVHPDAQGKGVGRELFQVVTDRADREGIKCYLESSKWIPNIQIYRKMGFELVREIECEDEGDMCKVGARFLSLLASPALPIVMLTREDICHGPRTKTEDLKSSIFSSLD
jgi:GNAT superfamily N-acetyltransferase